MDPINLTTEENKDEAANDKLREDISNELASYINPKIGKNPGEDLKNMPKNPVTESVTNFSEPKVVPETPKQIRPIIRTYKSDVEETVQAGHISSVNIAVAQNERMMRHVQSDTGLEKTRKPGLNKKIIIIIIILVIGGALALFIPYLLVQQKYTPTPVQVETVSPSSIITSEIQEKINIKDINLDRVDTTLKERVDQSATSLGQIKNIYLTEGDGVNEKLISAAAFLSLIKADVPPEIARTLKPEYMFGMYNYNGVQRFLILKVGAYDTTFAGMLSWEPSLWQDFKELFGLKSDVSATSTNTLGIEVKKFQDAQFVNKDVRMVKDPSGNIVFLYSIIDDNTVVITTSVDALKEIVTRTTQTKIVTQ